jgi:hypothetical protein
MADNTITIEHVIKGSDNNHGNVDISQLLRQQHSLLETLQSVATKLEKTIKPRTERKTPEEKQAEEIAKAKIKIVETHAKQNDKTMLAHMKAQEKQNKAEMDRFAKEEKTEEKLSQLKLKNQLKSYDLEQKNIVDTKKIIESQARREKQATEDFYKARNKNLSNAKAQEYSSWWQNTLNSQDDIANSAFKSKLNRQTGFGWSYKTGTPQNEPNEPLTAPSKLPLQIAGILAGSLVSYIGRELDISAQYTMAKAQNTGSFAQSTVMGRGMQDYPSYLASQVQAKKQEQIAQHTSNWAVGGQSLRYGIDALVGAGTFLLTKNKTTSLLAANFADNYASSLGDKFTNYFAAPGNAKLSKEGDLQSAETQRDAMLRTGMWTSSLARFNNRKGADTQGFMDRYGKDPNALGIQTIASNMNVPFNTQDLKSVANNFLQAGFSVDQFAKLTLQATQYQVISGKNIKEFSADMMKAKTKYYGAYDLSTNQTAIDLMTKGVDTEQAQKIAYQSQFNPTMLESVNRYLGNDRISFETKKGLGDATGIDFLSIEQDPSNAKKYMSPEKWKQFNEELNDFSSRDPKKRKYGDLMTLMDKGVGWDSKFMLGLRSGAPEGSQGELSKDATTPVKSEFQQAGSDIIQAIQQGLSNITTVSTTGNITVVGTINGTPPTKGSGGSPVHSLPFPF